MDLIVSKSVIKCYMDVIIALFTINLEIKMTFPVTLDENNNGAWV